MVPLDLIVGGICNDPGKEKAIMYSCILSDVHTQL
jgi:hypothetical protein